MTHSTYFYRQRTYDSLSDIDLRLIVHQHLVILRPRETMTRFSANDRSMGFSDHFICFGVFWVFF